MPNGKRWRWRRCWPPRPITRWSARRSPAPTPVRPDGSRCTCRMAVWWANPGSAPVTCTWRWRRCGPPALKCPAARRSCNRSRWTAVAPHSPRSSCRPRSKPAACCGPGWCSAPSGCSWSLDHCWSPTGWRPASCAPRPDSRTPRPRLAPETSASGCFPADRPSWWRRGARSTAWPTGCASCSPPSARWQQISRTGCAPR